MHAAEFIHVSKTYPIRGGLDRLFRNPFRRESLVALSDVSFSVDSGEVVALLGPNGSGKSTALKILASLILPTAGIARIEGRDTSKESLATRGRIGYCMAEERSFYFRLSGRQNLRFFGKLRGLSDARIERDIDDLAALLALDEVDERFMTYSTGTRQKLSVARSLMGDQPVLLLDEPTRGLDPYTSSLFLERLRLIASTGKTVILASHDLGAVDRIADRLIFLHKGEMLAEGSSEEVLNRFDVPSEIELEVAGAKEGWTAPLKEVPGIDLVEEKSAPGEGASRCRIVLGGGGIEPDELLRLLRGRFRTVSRLSLRKGSLEELYKRFSRGEET